MPLISALARNGVSILMTNCGYAKIIGKIKKSGFCSLYSVTLYHHHMVTR
jgi:hypothetical protein